MFNCFTNCLEPKYGQKFKAHGLLVQWEENNPEEFVENDPLDLREMDPDKLVECWKEGKTHTPGIY